MKYQLTAILALIAAPVFAQEAPTGDAAAGEKVFGKCQTCHVVANEAGEVLAGKGSKTGPNLYGMPGPQACLTSDPLGAATTGLSGGYVPAYDNLGTNNARTREEPSRWNSRRDADVRGRY